MAWALLHELLCNTFTSEIVCLQCRKGLVVSLDGPVQGNPSSRFLRVRWCPHRHGVCGDSRAAAVCQPCAPVDPFLQLLSFMES
jgi:hypothetical protein